MIFFQKEFSLDESWLTPQLSDIVKEACASYTETLGKRAVDTTALGLQLEEIILRFQDTYTSDTPCVLKGRKRFGSVSFELSKQDREADPLQIEDEMQGIYDILANLEGYPKYYYTSRGGGVNKVTIAAPAKKRKNGMLVNIFIAIALAIACFFLLQVLPGGAAQFVAESLVSPIFSKLIYILTEVATIFVFFAVITGILGIGDTASFGKMGKAFSIDMMVSYGIAAIVLVCMGSIFFGVSTAAAEGEQSVFGEVFTLVLDIIPNNLVEPFSTDNSLQVIVISIFFGVVILLLGEKVTRFRKIVLEAGDVVNKAMMIIIKAIPLIVFFGILNMLFTIDPGQLADVYLLVIAFFIGASLVLLVTIIRTRIVTKTPYSIIFKKQLPALIINLATSSQVSAMPDTIDCCKNRFGIDGRFVDFAAPLGVVVFMPCGAVFSGLLVWSLATMWGIPVSAAVVAKIVIVAVVVAIAAPPIPGSGLAVLPIVFAACALPGDAMPLAIIISTVLGYFLPAFNGMMIGLQMLLTAHRLDIVDEEALRTPWSEDRAAE